MSMVEERMKGSSMGLHSPLSNIFRTHRQNVQVTGCGANADAAISNDRTRASWSKICAAIISSFAPVCAMNDSIP
jgi:predicted protein tyrosine phosphatase